jgi:tubulin-specific chaperone A
MPWRIASKNADFCQLPQGAAKTPGMKPFTHLNLSAKLVASHLGLGLMALLFISFIFWMIASNALETVGRQGAAAVERVAYDELQAVCRTKEKQLIDLFTRMNRQLQMISSNPWVAEAALTFNEAFVKADRSQGLESWQILVRKYDALFSNVCTSLNWQDLFLISSTGSVVYSAGKGAELGLSLTREPLRSSSLGRAFAGLRSTTEAEMKFGDFAPYPPRRNEPAAFLITRVRHNEQVAAYLALQVNQGSIQKIMESSFPQGRGRTLEAYLVGDDGRMRSDSLLDPNHYSLAASFRQDNKVVTEAAQHALSNESGAGIIKNYRGATVLSAWMPVNIFGTRWALICEIDAGEAMKAKTGIKETLKQADENMLRCGSAALLLTVLVIALIAYHIARSINKPIMHAAQAAEAIASGDFSQRLNMRRSDEIGLMAEALDHTAERVAVNLWHKTGIAELAAQTRDKMDMRELAQSIITCLAKHLDAPTAALYLLDKDEQHLVLTGTYAFSRRKALNDRIRIGEGLAGQAARERGMILLSEVPEDYMRISSSLGEAAPRSILAAPFVHEGKLMGVLEFASFKEFSDPALDFLRNVLESVAVAFASAQSRQVQELLEETQRQAEELRQHSAELLAANEKLAAQSAELQAVQAELEASNADLEEKSQALTEQKEELEQRNAELLRAREDLEHRSKELALASKYKSEFLANMSHELRTPMNSLLLLARSLSANKDGNLTPNQEQAAEIIVEAGEDLLNIIDEILDLAKIEAGRVRKHLEEVLLADLADNAHAMFSHMAAAKGLAFKLFIDTALPDSIITDRTRLEQILKNFISNSLKFTAKGEVRLSFAWPEATTKFRNKDLTAEQVIAISVADTGIGIPVEHQQAIFEAFQQADGSTARKYGGTGLGLSISRELAALLGGEIHLQSEPGQGAVFTLYLPLAAADLPPAEEEPVIEDAAPPLTDDRSRIAEGEKNILVIEDDQQFAKFVLHQCHKYGFKVLAAVTGEEGLELADSFQPAGIILDIGLPGIDGWTVLQSLKANARTRHIPVHIVSATEASSEAFKLGAVGFLSKPVDQDQLQEVFIRFEGVTSRQLAKLLVAGDDSLRAAVTDLTKRGDTRTREAKTGEEVCELLAAHRFDCMILDLALADCNAIDLLRQLAEEESLTVPPVIIYTSRELSRDEEKELNSYSESIIVKNAHSKERLLDETNLFLHRVAGQLPPKRPRHPAELHDRDSLFADKKVLLVDDDMRNVFALSNALQEKGVRVIVAEDGCKALEALEREPETDLVLMDIMMPEMDGYEATRQIRRQPQFKKLPIIALTAKAMKEDRQKCIEAGASDYLAKPIDLERLLSMMRVWLYNGREDERT